MTKAASKEVAVKKSTAVSTAVDYGDYGSAGFEGMTSQDLSIPFLNLIQPLSKAVEDAGAKPGQLFNNVTGELIDAEEGIVFVPALKQHLFVEWVPLDQGGGFVAVHEKDSDIVKDAIKRNNGNPIGDLKTEAKNDLVETHYVYGLILDKEGKESQGFAVIAFSSSKIKVVRNWFTAMYMLKGQPPLFANRATIKSVKQKNKQGTFFNFKVEPFTGTWKDSLIAPDAPLLKEAADFKKMVEGGQARANFEAQDAVDGRAEAAATGDKAHF